MFEWCEKLMEATGCDLETAMREYHATVHPETYNADDYDGQ